MALIIIIICAVGHAGNTSFIRTSNNNESTHTGGTVIIINEIFCDVHRSGDVNYNGVYVDIYDNNTYGAEKYSR